MKFTTQCDASRRNVTQITLKNGLDIYTNSAQNYIISTHVISVSYLHSFIECVRCKKDVKTETITATGNHDEVFGLPYIVTWSWL
ncbi:hypothetical protein DYY66_0220 [Candidatus Nitrosotalea sp. FS]|nr:hypothetical protein [Candidatus Nitrosotalea sp. FS]